MHKQVKAFYDMAFEYHIAAVTLWTQIVSAPYLYNPISYLLRHTIELQMKGLIVCELRKDNSLLKPIKISFDDKAPDLSSGIPSLVIGETEEIGVISKGMRLIRDTEDIFDVVEVLFERYE